MLAPVSFVESAADSSRTPSDSAASSQEALLRSARLADVDRLYDLAQESVFGLTSLPKDRELLEERIYESVQSFERAVKRPGPEYYLFVLEQNGELIGSCAIHAKVGGYEPFYSYRMDTETLESQVLGVRREIQTLNLVEEHSGPAEIGALFLSDRRRGGGLGRFLSLARFLFMAEYPERFEENVIAEMRGRSDERGRSPFWDGLGRHFFAIDFPLADYMSVKDKRFIAELMPRHPVYVCLLSEEAQQSIGRTHEKTQGALAILQNEGFRFREMVDIFDGGPLIISSLRYVRTVRESRRAEIVGVEDLGDAEDVRTFYLANPSLQNFRAAPGRARLLQAAPGAGGRDRLMLDSRAAEALQLDAGNELRYAPPPAR